MTISNKLINEILIHGNDDWVMAAEVVSIVIEIEGTSYKEKEKIKAISFELIRHVVHEELMTIGDVRKGVFKQWEVSMDEAINKVENKWESLGRNPDLGEVCWLCNTENGNRIAINLINTTTSNKKKG
jgi:hypothetical protein